MIYKKIFHEVLGQTLCWQANSEDRFNLTVNYFPGCLVLAKQTGKLGGGADAKRSC